MSDKCPCCLGKGITHLKTISEFSYYQCNECRSIFIDEKFLDTIDNGSTLVKYEKDYWQKELSSSWERSFGVALARMAEAIYYSRIPINKFIDIGTGAGYFLDAVNKYLPNKSNIFYGTEKFPPPPDYQTKSENYIIGDLQDVQLKFDGGICIEVIEHLTPKMLFKLLKDLARISNEGALYVFNTGLPEYVLNEDINYLDPIIRGHIVSYSTRAIQSISADLGFNVIPITGKTWAFVLEYKSTIKGEGSIVDRIWTALDHNLNILNDKDMGCVLKVLGLETTRAYI